MPPTGMGWGWGRGGDSFPCYSLSRMSLDSRNCQHTPSSPSFLPARPLFLLDPRGVRQPHLLCWPSSVMDLYNVWLFRSQIPFILPQVQVSPHHSQFIVTTTFLRSSLAMQGNQEHLVITGVKPGSMCWLMCCWWLSGKSQSFTTQVAGDSDVLNLHMCD